MVSTIKHLYSCATCWPFVWIKDIRLETVKLLGKKNNENIDIVLSNDLVFCFYFGCDVKSTGSKTKNKQVGLHQTKNPQHNKGYNQ